MGKSSAAGEKNWRQTKAFRELRQSMLEDLTARGLVDRAYTDKVEEYMDFWVQRQKLEADIAARGVTVVDAKRGMPVENRSVSLSVQVSRQMLAIFTALGLKDDACAASPQGDDDDEL
ncbi:MULTISPECIES: P27 family phage terminase small subunit [Oscillospiraceae]|uniref:P27 family phage terminase small subunit n=1 Tax=Oscillospiraceae TaxID=216572 RepID=UPI000B37F8FB|nr:P27 family phage terminase small subunit [Flavonifractor sp. An306]MBM6725015.1 P27 family phage terminase small subunit [Pseudoflavonifractor phocaeensis]OUO36422.1 hypothetical protein B5F88_13970 [Flavonifractor sp. An306]